MKAESLRRLSRGGKGASRTLDNAAVDPLHFVLFFVVLYSRMDRNIGDVCPGIMDRLHVPLTPRSARAFLA